MTHADWGAGDVVAVEGDTITVLFETHGYRTLSVDLVLERDLLRRPTPPPTGPPPPPRTDRSGPARLPGAVRGAEGQPGSST